VPGRRVSEPERVYSNVGENEFVAEAEGYRRELLAYCYRMVGSVHEAEDLVQETYLRAWRGQAGFEGRASLRTWLYRIATNVCLKALRGNQRRALPSGLAGFGSPDDVPWLGPIPDAVVASRAGLRLAFVAALQHLTPRQRAVLILRDVLDYRAAEVAGLLGISTTAVNSVLRRARDQIERAAPDAETVSEPVRSTLLDRYVTAFEAADVRALTALLTDDVTWEMPPNPEWYAGRPAVTGLLESRFTGRPGDNDLLMTAANGQPAVAVYAGGRAHSIQVLELDPRGVSRVVAFHDPRLFRWFRLTTTRERGTT
jgi:RNA polymerase sigma-70 factor (ECF subfamily)